MTIKGLIMVRTTVAAICLIVGLSTFADAMEGAMETSDSLETRHIILLGASVGRDWKIDRLPERVGNHTYSFEYVGNYSPDKSKELDDILGRTEARPDAVILKECAAFFPGSSERIKGLIERWVGLCRGSGVTPILATVVPVVKSYPLRMFVYHLLHGKWSYPKGTFESIIAFNDWLIDYADAEGLALLDLEAAVRTSPTDRHLCGRYARRDGLHLNDKAYRELDEIVIPLLDTVDFDRKGSE